MPDSSYSKRSSQQVNAVRSSAASNPQQHRQFGPGAMAGIENKVRAIAGGLPTLDRGAAFANPYDEAFIPFLHTTHDTRHTICIII